MCFPENRYIIPGQEGGKMRSKVFPLLLLALIWGG